MECFGNTERKQEVRRRLVQAHQSNACGGTGTGDTKRRRRSTTGTVQPCVLVNAVSEKEAMAGQCEQCGGDTTLCFGNTIGK